MCLLPGAGAWRGCTLSLLSCALTCVLHSGYSAAIVILSWLSGAINGPRQKRAVATAFINAVANSPNCWTAYLYSGTPRYVAGRVLGSPGTWAGSLTVTVSPRSRRFVLAFSVNAAACAAVIIFAGFTRIYLARENAKIDAGKPVAKSGPTREEIDAGFRCVPSFAHLRPPPPRSSPSADLPCALSPPSYPL